MPPHHPSIYPIIHPFPTPPRLLPFSQSSSNPLHLQTLHTLQPAKSGACDPASVTTASAGGRERQGVEGEMGEMMKRGGRQRERRLQLAEIRRTENTCVPWSSQRSTPAAGNWPVRLFWCCLFSPVMSHSDFPKNWSEKRRRSRGQRGGLQPCRVCTFSPDARCAQVHAATGTLCCVC